MADERDSRQINDMVLCSLKKHVYFIGLMLQGRHVKLISSAKGRIGYKKPPGHPARQSLMCIIWFPDNTQKKPHILI